MHLSFPSFTGSNSATILRFQITSLHKIALISKHPLTGLYFDVAITLDTVNLDQLPDNLFPKQAIEGKTKIISIKIRFIHSKDESSVLYVEVGQFFVDLLLSLLSIPLGSIIKAYSQRSPNGCIDKYLQEYRW